MLGIGKVFDFAADALGLPEVVGDIAKIGVGVFTGDPMLIADGVIDITPNVCDFLESELDLGAAEPGEPDSFWKKLGRGALEMMRKEAEIAEKIKPLVSGPAGAGASGGAAAGPALLGALA